MIGSSLSSRPRVHRNPCGHVKCEESLRKPWEYSEVVGENTQAPRHGIITHNKCESRVEKAD
jgi:hypothetical protein